jgi:hypothetical protein
MCHGYHLFRYASLSHANAASILSTRYLFNSYQAERLPVALFFAIAFSTFILEYDDLSILAVAYDSAYNLRVFHIRLTDPSLFPVGGQKNVVEMDLISRIPSHLLNSDLVSR